MSKLEVIFQLGLAHPLVLMDAPSRQARVAFPETGNTVWIETPRPGPRPEPTHGRRGFDTLLVHVERECSPQDRETINYYATVERWGVAHDAARALWQVLELIRDEDFVRNETVAGYPVAPSEAPQQNPVVEATEATVLFDGEVISSLALGGLSALQVSWGVWDRVCERFERGETVPTYRSFLLDAFYFATSGDPLRAVIMACAAWETALRQFLSGSTSRDAALAKNVKQARLPDLLLIAEKAKGVRLFDQVPEGERHRRAAQIKKLATLRNKLLHEGRKDLPKGEVVDMVLIVDAAIGWLFS